MSLINEMKRYRDSPVLAPVLVLKRRLQEIWNKLNVEVIFYAPYEVLCSTFSKRPEEKVTRQQIAEFQEGSLLVLKDVVSQEVIDRIFKSSAACIAEGKIISTDLLWNSRPSISKRVFDRFFRNLYLTYSYPETHLRNLTYIRNPLVNVSGLREAIQSNLQPIANCLIGCRTEVVRSWVYRTNNFHGEESLNHNGKMHLDGDRDSSIKCLVYLNDVDRDNGPFAYRDRKTGKEITVTGPAGTVVIFRSSLLWHKGSNTLRKERLCMSFLAHPALRDSLPKSDVSPNFIRKTIPFLPCTKAVYVD